MEIFTKAVGKMEKLMEKEFYLIKLMVIFMMESGNKISKMDLELNHGPKELLYIKDSLLKE